MNELMSTRVMFTFDGMILGGISLMHLFPFLGLRSVIGSLIGAIIGALAGYLIGRRIDLKKCNKENDNDIKPR